MDSGDNGNSRREQLTEQATEYLKANGLASLTYRKLAYELGVAPNTLEHHFGTKDKLLEQLLERLAEEQRGGLQATLRQEDAGPELVSRYVRAAMVDISNLENEGASQLFFELVGASMREHDLYGEFLSHAMNDWIDFISRFLVERTEVPESRARVVAHLILATIRGIMLSRAMVEASERPLLDEAGDLLGPLLESLIRSESGTP
ncbi:helix-turn-helix domain-containing protein [Ferrimicrobium sp.]|uniref:TetR/AcrR family transcriptional regulator n=1 Tax=Ferrimicrobium sp. TaxID=2926050 RepID=UPI00261AE8CC|nr:helix-turn-helix domain-containing protein [Ferrimicrobium sp.]